MNSSIDCGEEMDRNLDFFAIRNQGSASTKMLSYRNTLKERMR